MKKFSAIIIAMALVLGMSQCKKQETPSSNNTEDGMVYITVNVDNDGGRHHIEPSVGAYVFTNGDSLYVGNNGHYVGKLGYKDGAFSGGIQSPSTEDYLHFYFLGGKEPVSAPTTSTTDFTISISDQSSNLPVLAYGHSTTKYTTDGNATYSTTMRNKCALVEFATNEIPVETAVSISGMKNTVQIDFTNHTINPTGTPGSITLYAESATSRWAILLPDNSVSTTATAEGYNESESFTVPAVANNGYLAGTNAVSFEMIDYVFTVGSGTTVHFSPGNLYYDGANWGFESTPQYGQYTYPGYINVFNWGATGNTTNGGVNIYTTAEYTTGNVNLSVLNGTDWGGVVGALDGHSDWRTLSNDEWRYLFYTRTNASMLRGYGNVNGINGLIVLPDNYDGTAINTNLSSWSNNTISDWSGYASHGAVFLPAAGYREDYQASVSNTGDYGHYWSSSSIDTDNVWKLFYFANGIYSFNDHKNHGSSVRLVR